MYEYRIDKKINELDPIPTTWSAEQRKAFFDTGSIPIAGDTPQVGAEPKTMRVSMEEIFSDLSRLDAVMMLESPAALVGNGTFNLRKLYSAGPEIEVSGSNVLLPPGWYRYGARVDFNFTGTPINETAPITLSGNLHGNNQHCIVNFDFSYLHTEQLALSDLIYNDGATDSPYRVSDVSPLNTYRNFNLSISGVPSSVTAMSATLVLHIERVRLSD
jgi:hypothetical protein